MQYKISGIVIKGDGYGRKLGYPTVNLDPEVSIFPPIGVYAGEAMLGNKKYHAGIVVGPLDKIEAHLIGDEGDAYGKKVTLHILKFIREYKKFFSEEELIKQIGKDLAMC